MLGIDYRDSRPIYEQVVDGVEEMIVRGVWQPDSQLPSVRQLAGELSINPNTISRAYGELEKRGVIYSVKGKGSFVAPDGSQLRLRRLEEIAREMARLADAARALGADDSLLCAWVSGKEDNV